MNIQDEANKDNIRIVILMPKLLKQYLTACALEAQCKLQDEVIKRLAATFEHKAAYDAIQMIVTEAINVALSNQDKEVKNAT